MTNPTARFETDLGAFELSLDFERAPITAKYFAGRIENGLFDGSTFFRIVAADNASLRADNPIEVLQCGPKPGAPYDHPALKHETTATTGLCHRRWTASTARDAPEETYGSFFICMRDEPELDFGGRRHPDGQGFAAFGQVVSGFETIEAIFAKREPDEFLQTEIVIHNAYFRRYER